MLSAYFLGETVPEHSETGLSVNKLAGPDVRITLLFVPIFVLPVVISPGPADTEDDQDEDEGCGDADQDANEKGEVLHLGDSDLQWGGAAVFVMLVATAVNTGSLLAGGTVEPGVPFTN